jgi:Rad3-related DNA helicase
MLFDMKQGVGRLLRTKFDKGVVAILDVRGWTGTKSTELHMKRLQQIKYAPTKQPIGYGLKLVQTLGYANRIADNFEVCEKFINKFFPEQ